MRPIILFFSLFLLFLSGCDRRIEQPLERTKTLIILTRPGSVTYAKDPVRGDVGFDYDLARLFAEHLGLKPKFIVANSDSEVLHRLQRGEAHFAAAWQTPPADQRLRSSAPYFYSQNVLVTHEASLPLLTLDQLTGKTVQVVAGSRQEAALIRVKQKLPTLNIAAQKKRSELDLMEDVATRRHEAALVSKVVFNVGSNYYPELQSSLEIGEPQPVVWVFAQGVDQHLIDKANDFLESSADNGLMDRLKDRYFGHVERLATLDSVRFIERMRSILPRYKSWFQAAQASTGIDWRLLAALSYQESHWNPLSTSPTGVRGIMMLTEETADELKVSNRLDPEQGIRAGAKYLNDLRDALPASILPPDRTWMALAAYNLGMGHLNAARRIAKSRNANPDSWYEMKRILPLLSQPRYYTRLKSGKGRGGEAVIMVENIRAYADILRRYERDDDPVDRLAKSATAGNDGRTSGLSAGQGTGLRVKEGR